MTEKRIDDLLCKAIALQNGLCLKLLSYMFSGFPDRTILLPGGRIYFCELKSKGEKAKKLQAIVHKKLVKLSFEVFVLDSEETLNSFLTHIKTK